MKVSNLADVGQIRSKSGISMKIMRKELALQRLSGEAWERQWITYRQRAPKRIIMLTWKRCEMPRAKQRNIHITPVLP
jgi:hypothetical protein